MVRDRVEDEENVANDYSSTRQLSCLRMVGRKADEVRDDRAHIWCVIESRARRTRRTAILKHDKGP